MQFLLESAQQDVKEKIPWELVVIVISSIFLLAALFVVFKWGYLYIKAKAAGADVRLIALVGMSIRKVNPRLIVDSRIACCNAGVPVPTERLENLYLAGGRVPNVVRALIAAHQANLPMDFNKAAGIDLAGRDVVDAVQTSVSPKVIDCPNPKQRETLDAVAKDGIQLRVKARVTVRMNVQKLIGGAVEETIIARVGEGIVSSIGSAESYKEVLANPDNISKEVLKKGLDANTAFEIVSIDIADVDVGENIGARLQVHQAEANLKMAQAEAETRRAMAVAREQEMVALDRENRAKVTLAEAEVPLAMSQALREGKIGVLDLYGMRNLQADTDMRRSIAEPKPPSSPPAKPDTGK